jgi:hypothetical protein
MIRAIVEVTAVGDELDLKLALGEENLRSPRGAAAGFI